MIGDCIVDASVGIKLFLAEEGSESAHALFRQLTTSPPARFFVPDLFFIECANILWKYVRRYSYPAANARQDVHNLQQLRLEVVSTADLLLPAWELALTHDITAYDASYVALAQQLSLPLVTADVPLSRKLASSEITAYILTDLSQD